MLTVVCLGLIGIVISLVLYSNMLTWFRDDSKRIMAARADALRPL
ncbi:MAG: hypothetical protein AAGB48_03990 [Planctomycetota bacterium]